MIKDTFRKKKKSHPFWLLNYCYSLTEMQQAILKMPDYHKENHSDLGHQLTSRQGSW